jgi:glycosyltransferase involved in cell wall biosynthesis
MVLNPMELNGTHETETPEQREACLRAIQAIQVPLPPLAPWPSERPDVSILLCSFNRPLHLATLLDQLKCQTYPNFEIIIVGGPGSSYLPAHPPPATIFFPSSIRSLGIVRNLSILLSRGDILLFLDDDSYVMEDFVERHVHLHLYGEGKKAAALQGHCLGVPCDHRGNGWVRRKCTFRPVGTTLRTLHTTNCSIKRQALETIGGFNITLRFDAEDSELGSRFDRAGYVIRNAPEVVSIHRGAATGGARPRPDEVAQRIAGRIADAALTHISLQRPLRAVLCIAKGLEKTFLQNPMVFTRHFSIVMKESVGYFIRHLKMNSALYRQKHLEITRTIYLDSGRKPRNFR